MNNIKVSIITVSFNSESTIEQTIKSVLFQKQKYSNIEYIVIDGDSNDKTVDILKRYENQIDILISEKDEGIYYAMNKGVSFATGDYVIFINSDDWLESDAIGSFLKHIDTIDADIVYGMIREIKNNKEYSIVRRHHDFLNERMIPHPSSFVKTSVLKDLDCFNTGYKYAADYDFMLKAMEKGYKFSALNKIITNFRLGGSTNSVTRAAIESLNVKRSYNVIGLKEYLVQSFIIYLKKVFKRL